MLAVLIAATCLASSQTRRIAFAPGQTSIVLRGRLKPYRHHLYRFHARAGQRLTLRLHSPRSDVVCWVEGTTYVRPDTKVLEGIDKGGVTDWSGELPATEAYEIYVSNPPISDHRVRRILPYTLEITIK